jgi:hypothetical protein
MTRPGKRSITAGIYQVATGRELRVHSGPDVDNLLDSLLSRDGDVPLEFRATELRAVVARQRDGLRRCDARHVDWGLHHQPGDRDRC